MLARIAVGTQFNYQNSAWKIESVQDDEIQVAQQFTDARAALKVDELLKLFESGSLSFTRRLTAVEQAGQTDDLAIMPEEEQKRLLYKHAYVDYAHEARATSTRREIEVVIAKVSARIKDRTPPSVRTVQRWLEIYRAYDYNLYALRDRHRHKGNRRERMPAYLDELIDRAIHEVYLTRERNSVQQVCDWLADELTKKGLQDSFFFKQQNPCNAVYRRIKKLQQTDPYGVCVAREGKQVADHLFAYRKPVDQVTHILERVEIDHTKLDMFVVSEQGIPLGRPWLTFAIDVYSRMIVGFYVSFTPPSLDAVIQTLKHTILSKSYIKQLYPFIKNDWPAFGAPVLIVVDNGLEFKSIGFHELCKLLNIKENHCPVLAPAMKGAIERTFRSINQGLLKEMPGSTQGPDNPLIKCLQGFNPRKHAVLTLPTLLALIHVWVVDIYHTKAHRGAMDVPLERWRRSAKVTDILMPPSIAELKKMFGKVAQRKLTKSYIEFNNVSYSSQELVHLSHRLHHHRIDPTVKFKYDPQDLNEIQVWDQFNQVYLTAYSTTPDYTTGLTEWQHKAHRRYVRRFMKEQVNQVTLMQARATIAHLVQQEMGKLGKISTKQQIARLANLRQPDYAFEFETSTEVNMAPDPSPSESVATSAPVVAEVEEYLDWGDDEDDLEDLNDE